MNSMTGYGFSEYLCEEYQLAVEIKTYNNRYLDIACSLPPLFNAFEMALNEKIKSSLQRGRVEVYVRLKTLSNNYEIRIDEAALREYVKAFKKLEALTKIKSKLRLADLIKLEGLLVPVYTNDAAKYGEVLFSLFEEALSEVALMRSQEGLTAQQDVVNMGKRLLQGLEVVKSLAGELEKRLKEELFLKMEELLGDKGFKEDRILQEVALLVNKATINEEIVRLEAHLKALFKLVEEEGPVGKKLDFLAQELNREVNTIGSKNIILEISQEIVAMKEAVENIREQVRNVE